MTARSDAAALDYKDAVFISPHKFIGGPGTPGAARGAFGTADQLRPGRSRRWHRRLRQRGRARLPRRPRASRGRRHAGHHRVDPGRPRLPAQAAGRGYETIRDREESFIERALAALERAARPGDPRRPRIGPALDRQLRRPARRAATCTTTTWWRCSTTSSASSRAAAAPAPARTATGCWASTSRPATSSSARSPAAARASSPAGSGSTSTTSSARRSSSTSSRRSSWSPVTAGACCRSTASIRPPACGTTSGARPRRRCRCTTSATLADGMRYEAHRRQEPESRLADYLAEARALLAIAAGARRASPRAPPTWWSATDFEGLRWFLLPDEAASELGTAT